MQTLRHLVSGTDFSECAARALELAITIAAASRAHIALVHVCELGADDADDSRLRECGQALSAFVARHQRRDVEITGVLRSGRPWEKLDNVAVEVGAGLIVIGRQGAGCSASADIGSVAQRLVRCASRPVLTIPCDF